MRPLSVVECHPILDHAPGVEAVGDFFEGDRFLFQAAPEPFDKDVVQIAATPIYYRQCIGKANVTRGIEIRTSALVSVVIQADPVNWLP